jgi:hypothetical protein
VSEAEAMLAGALPEFLHQNIGKVIECDHHARIMPRRS